MKSQESSTDFLPTSTLAENRTKESGKTKFKVFLQLLLLVGIVSVWGTHLRGNCHHNKPSSPVLVSKPTQASCVQAEPLLPTKHHELWTNLTMTIASDNFKLKAVNRLSRAVQIPTVSWDGMDPVGVDPRWEVFRPFQEYLLGAFPLVHTTLKLTKVNTYGLIFEWKGTSPGLKPVLLAAHQDVVPVEMRTRDKWTHPPFSGHFDGESIWGRGSSDDKSGLIAILSAVETLISNRFQPSRTFVLAFGFDEEVSGAQGAGRIALVLLNLYGKNGFAFVVDEGSGFGLEYDTIFATPGIAEKGYFDVRVDVGTTGGHSSVPPDHTSIGILAAMMVHYEQSPFTVHVTRDHPIYRSFQCFAEHSNGMHENLRELIHQSRTSDNALLKLTDLLSNNRVYKSLIGTTQAIDLVNGGIKTNALPEQAYAIVNHRIALSSSVEETKSRDKALLKSLAQKFNLTYMAFGECIICDEPSQGNLTLQIAFSNSLEPAPATPTDATPYQLLSGTIKAAYNIYRGLEGSNNVVVAPGMMTWNTDTRHYWDLSPSILRYSHRNSGESSIQLNGIHTVNEHMEINALVEMIEFFVTLILNSDESTEL